MNDSSEGIFPFRIGQKVICIRGQAGFEGYAEDGFFEPLLPNRTYVVRSCTPNYVKVDTLAGNPVGASWDNARFVPAPEDLSGTAEVVLRADSQVRTDDDDDEPNEALKELVRRNRFHDPVEHPTHYTSIVPGIECIDVVKHFNFCRGNAIKYIWRAGAKGDEVEDLRKAIKNLEFEIERIQNGSSAD